MAGKVNLPPDVDRRKDIEGSPSGAPGLNAVDEERASSMADEGGVSASAVEDRPKRPKRRKEDFPKSPVRPRGR
jgi:hypothetical protein